MGVTWGVVAYRDSEYMSYDRDKLIAEWEPLAKLCRRSAGFSIMHGDDCINFRRERVPGTRDFQSVITVTQDPDARAKIDGLSGGDGTYDLFEQLFDGYEIFVPWSPSKAKISAPGSTADGMRGESIDLLYNSMQHMSWHPPEDPDLAGLAKDLFEAAKVAKDLNMLIRINF